MIEDNYNILKTLKKNNQSIKIDEIEKIIIDGFKNEILSSSDDLLLKLIFSEKNTQEDLDKFLEHWDIEVVGGHKALMLAYFMKMHPELKYSDYIAPRLKGLLQFYRFQNMKLISHYTRIGKELAKANINFLIFKGGCMKYLRPEFPRVMGDIDILVKKSDWEKAGKIAEQMGYDTSWDIHSIDLHPKDSEEGIMDIHKYIIMESEKEEFYIPDLFKRATKEKVFGLDAFVPANEDMVFIMLVNMIRNLRHKTSYTGILYNLFDCKFLIDSKPDFNWDIILENAKKTKTETHICLAVQFLNSIVPNILPQSFKITDEIFKKEFKKYCILLIYQRFFLWEMKQKSHKMKVKNLFSSFEFFKEYIKLKPKYFILKLGIIRKNPILTENILKYKGIIK